MYVLIQQFQGRTHKEAFLASLQWKSMLPVYGLYLDKQGFRVCGNTFLQSSHFNLALHQNPELIGSDSIILIYK